MCVHRYYCQTILSQPLGGLDDHPWKQIIRLHQPNWAVYSLHAAAWLITMESSTACFDTRSGKWTSSCGPDKSSHIWRVLSVCRSPCWRWLKISADSLLTDEVMVRSMYFSHKLGGYCNGFHLCKFLRQTLGFHYIYFHYFTCFVFLFLPHF